ncbi:MAG: alpha/beta fold hydrolase [Streptosporangiaceae bacterium]|nr:alpha/beta fold hydrolase [Streptosporangiaceae bacterium]
MRNIPRARGKRLIATAATGSLAVTGLALTLAHSADAAAAAGSTNRTSPDWARLVDQVPTPVLHWTTCQQTDQCATAVLPLDYRNPHGATIQVALLRVKAKDPKHRLGTIFVNPGGPGDTARDFAAEVPQAVPRAILDKFDIVGVDPRGTGGSTPIDCFATATERARTEAPLTGTPFPVTPGQQHAWVDAAKALGRACSTTARSIASNMSTTDDALDMDVLRRAVGDSKLTYVGESYGSYLGLIYANIFPDRIRAMALDSIVNAPALAGTTATARVPAFDRMGAAAASDHALRGLLVLCQQAGSSRCSFASPDTSARYDRLAAQLRAHPLRLAAPGIKTTTLGYADLVADTEHWMHDPSGYQGLFPELTDLVRLTAPGGAGTGRAAVVRDLERLRSALAPPPAPGNQLEAFSGQACSDGAQAANATSWPAAAATADRSASYFGSYYAWLSVQCARSTWTASDRDAYRGPFDHHTAAPVLLIGNLWDPVDSYANAAEMARLMPGSRLVRSDSWGHQALNTSACVDSTTWNYLINPRTPAPKITYCRGDVQPFASATTP